MTTHNEPSIARRPFLRGAGVTLAALGGMTGSAVARGHGKGKADGGVGHLADTPANFAIHWSDVADDGDDSEPTLDPNEWDEFVPLLPGPEPGFDPGYDQAGAPGLFDGSNIKITPNHKTLHHSFQLFAGFLMKGKPKPYTLVNQGGGTFESRGQSSNFEARSAAEIEALLGQAFPGGVAHLLANNPPFGTLAGGKWRAVANEQLKVDLTGDEPFDSEWAATRVDIYSRGDGKPEYTLSLLYTLWASENLGAMDPAMVQTRSLVAGGRLNPGGR